MLASHRSGRDVIILHQHQERDSAAELPAELVHICLRWVTFTTVAHGYLDTVISLCMQVDQLVHAQELMLHLSADCNAELQARLRARRM